ncbi:G-D-S-L family lipolytic protein [Psychroflexus sp. CAK57W]|uniref:G-D-S-L family lipolytic protein n=1 Tax=Psychroflexus curvus TaxID=2873595 RepID=UPI001CCA3687|nr:G-D-S-L family lipolytic protein [Psychroflexus curvus]MBZ9786764.1 G-D-S-L family lipolytic protein [Psychroflexus curvus]
MNYFKYIFLPFLAVSFMACENEPLEDLRNRGVQEEPEATEEFTQGSANFSTYVALGNSLTAGFSDGALYKISQENSMPSILADRFSTLADGGSFTQPLMNDNIGGLLAGGNPLPGFNPRLVFGGSGPVPLSSVVGPIQPTTDILNNNPTGPFNNLGVPGAKSFHLLAPGYGNVTGVFANPPSANPYFVRMASSPQTTVIADAIAQQPTFISLWIGNNDVLGYALSGGDGSNPITPMDGPPGVGFQQTYGAIAGLLTGNIPNVQGIMANIPNVTAIPHFTTVPHNPLDPSNPDFADQIPTLNAIFGAINQVFVALGETNRIIEFTAEASNAVVINDESLTDVSAQIAGALAPNPQFIALVESFGLPAQAAPLVANLLGNTYGQARQATEEELLVLPSSSIIGTVNTDRFAFLVSQGLSQELAGQFSVEGITLPLADKWVLLPEEQEEIATATAQFNQVISGVASANGFALLDANALLDRIATSGVVTNDLILTSNLVTGGAFSLDGVHPTSRGYALIANEMLKAIDVTYGSNFEASGNLVDVSTYNTNYSPGLIN